jgi:hypothetical protein
VCKLKENIINKKGLKQSKGKKEEITQDDYKKEPKRPYKKIQKKMLGKDQKSLPGIKKIPREREKKTAFDGPVM